MSAVSRSLRYLRREFPGWEFDAWHMRGLGVVWRCRRVGEVHWSEHLSPGEVVEFVTWE